MNKGAFMLTKEEQEELVACFDKGEEGMLQSQTILQQAAKRFLSELVEESEEPLSKETIAISRRMFGIGFLLGIEFTINSCSVEDDEEKFSEG